MRDAPSHWSNETANRHWRGLRKMPLRTRAVRTVENEVHRTRRFDAYSKQKKNRGRSDAAKF